MLARPLPPRRYKSCPNTHSNYYKTFVLDKLVPYYKLFLNTALLAPVIKVEALALEPCDQKELLRIGKTVVHPIYKFGFKYIVHVIVTCILMLFY